MNRFLGGAEARLAQSVASAIDHRSVRSKNPFAPLAVVCGASRCGGNLFLVGRRCAYRPRTGAQGGFEPCGCRMCSICTGRVDSGRAQARG